MFKKSRSFLHIFLCCFFSAGVLFSNAGTSLVSAEAANEEDYEVPSTEENPHTAYYDQAADTNSIEGWPVGPNIEGQAAVLMDVNTGAVLYSKNADTELYPASITKIMTTLLACENLNRKEKLVVSQAAAYGIEAGSSSIYADTDEEFIIDQALMAVMLESANEMSLAVAERVSGSVKKFVELMNQRARSIGCTHTHFNNPNGLTDENHYTSASDMAKIARTAWTNPMFVRYCTRDIYEIPPTNKQPETRYLLNHHKMMKGRDYAYDGVLGGKTGYTVAAGNTLVTYAKRNHLTLVAVVLNSIGGAYSDTAALLDYGFNNFELVAVNTSSDISTPGSIPGQEYILENSGSITPLEYRSKTYVTLPAGTDPGTLTTQRTHLFNAVGPSRIRVSYYLGDTCVGYGMQYEKEVLSNLLLDSAL